MISSDHDALLAWWLWCPSIILTQWQSFARQQFAVGKQFDDKVAVYQAYEKARISVWWIGAALAPSIKRDRGDSSMLVSSECAWERAHHGLSWRSRCSE